tara:strand:- start:127 stop:960 length:834 start_codon:yes stop_codon:yes gene_type:complete
MSNQSKTIGLLGCGWLGYHLALSLKTEGFLINGSTTQESKVSTLSEASINPFVIHFGQNESGLKEFLEVDILILALPPSMKGQGEIYLDVLKKLGGMISSLGQLRVLFVSSTGVYGNDQGAVDEFTPPRPTSKRGENLLAAEEEVKSWGREATILRFAGLVGGTRHPVFSLNKRRGKKLGKGPMNLIHRDDCIGIIKTLINLETWGELYNGVSPFHPPKEQYYNSVCDFFNLPYIQFVESEGGKKVEGVNLQRKLNYKFIYPELSPNLFTFKEGLTV